MGERGSGRVTVFVTVISLMYTHKSSFIEKKTVLKKNETALTR